VDLICFCENDVNQLTFVYGGPQGGTIECNDGSDSLLVFSDLEEGAVITFVALGVDSITCEASDSTGSSIGSPFTIDSSCDGGRPLVLQQEFGDGGILTFQEYVCTDGESHSCLFDVDYNIEICNLGLGNEDLSSIQLIIREDPPTVIETVNLSSSTSILQGACVSVPYDSQVNVCNKKIYTVAAIVIADEPNTGIPCNGTDVISFDSFENTLPPTVTPTPAPTPSPSRDGTSGQPTPGPRECPPTDPNCVPCTSDCECEALFPGETTGVCICEDELPDDCEFDDNGGVDNGGTDGDDDGGNGDDDSDNGDGKKSGSGDDDDGSTRRRRRVTTSGKKSGDDDDDDNDGGGTDGGGTDGGTDGSIVFSANCCDCECLEKPCTCECFGYDDPVSPGQQDGGDNGDDGDDDDDGGKKSGSRNRQRRRNLEGGEDEVDHSHFRSRRASRVSSRHSLHQVEESDRIEGMKPSTNSETNWQSWIFGSIWKDVDESASGTKDSNHRSLADTQTAFNTPMANLLVASSGKKSGGKKSGYGYDGYDDGGDDGDDDGDDDSGGVDDCERPAYQCYYRKFYPGETRCVSRRVCKANTVGFCQRG
jgi:hypothetical protein